VITRGCHPAFEPEINGSLSIMLEIYTQTDFLFSLKNGLLYIHYVELIAEWFVNLYGVDLVRID